MYALVGALYNKKKVIPDILVLGVEVSAIKNAVPCNKSRTATRCDNCVRPTPCGRARSKPRRQIRPHRSPIHLRPWGLPWRPLRRRPPHDHRLVSGYLNMNHAGYMAFERTGFWMPFCRAS